ncbi:GNAT family N-acetyltransferase [Flavobacterium urumqiense]|uniref:GNAT family N-acetyltransferase n=1 Tax=Flavobacterium urumqiense TaxID=935224 RepID=UPI000CDE6C78
MYTNDAVVGYVIITFSFSFEYHSRIGILDDLYLSDSARGKGIGKKTVAFIQAKAQQLNLKIIYLEVENHNENAQKLCLASNFIFLHRKLMKYIVK